MSYSGGISEQGIARNRSDVSEMPNTHFPFTTNWYTKSASIERKAIDPFHPFTGHSVTISFTKYARGALPLEAIQLVSFSDDFFFHVVVGEDGRLFQLINHRVRTGRMSWSCIDTIKAIATLRKCFAPKYLGFFFSLFVNLSRNIFMSITPEKGSR